MHEKEFFHKTVLLKEAIDGLNIKPNGVYVDATFGGGGHSRAILEKDPTIELISIDWDKEAIEANSKQLEDEFEDRFKVVWGNFGQLYKILKKEKIKEVDGILADFGTSQFQIHNKTGFSFQTDTPLDMRMSPAHHRQTAADIVNNATERELLKILFTYGEESQAKKIVKSILKTRAITPITTTSQLTQAIEQVIPVAQYRQKFKIHPATKTFQALRIVVNNELENIVSFLQASVNFLKPAGRLVCISFHSLEDRLVKNFFKDNYDQLETLTNKPITASQEELEQNPSSRSAKLRVAKKISVDNIYE